MKNKYIHGMILITCLASYGEGMASNWSKTELQFQKGTLDNPFAGTKSDTDILTFQHASTWKHGDTFFFLDYLEDDRVDGYNDADIHAETYVNLSAKKIFLHQTDIGYGLRDIGLTLGYDFTTDSNIKKIIPGLRFDWNVPSFAFFNTLVAFYIDQSGGLSSGGAPAQDNSYIVDLSYKRPISWGSAKFSVEGHMEWVGARELENGAKSTEWFLSQMQFRYDLGKNLFNSENKFFVGTEWQYWQNKLGIRNVDENAFQLLAVWNLY
jgi:hypothetical protein